MNYQQQASDFLAKYGISFSFKLANTKRPSWDENRQCNHFVVTFKKGRRSISFDFFDSVHNFQKGIKELGAYSVLACCSSEIYCPETFEEFCVDYGYEAYSSYNGKKNQQSAKTFAALKKQSVKLQKFFDTEEMRDNLSEIC